MGAQNSKPRRARKDSLSKPSTKARRRSSFGWLLKCPYEAPEVVIVPDSPKGVPPAAPLPPCNSDRLATVQAGKYNIMHRPDILNILDLVRSIAEAPIALIAIFGDKKVYIRDALGLPKFQVPYDISICAWLLSTAHPCNLVVEDIDQDDRFKSNRLLKENGIKAYCGAPLIASNGHRLGSIAFMDVKPRAIGLQLCQLLNNFAELVVRELEQDIALRLHKERSGHLQQMYSQLVRGLDCFQQALLLVEATEQRWQVLHCNQAWTKETGLAKEMTVNRSILGIFQHVNGEQLGLSQIRQAHSMGEQFSIQDMCTRDCWDGRCMTLTFRSASNEPVDGSTQRIGVPAVVASTALPRDFYFITVTFHSPTSSPSDSCTSNTLSVKSTPSLSSLRVPSPTPSSPATSGKGKPGARPCPVPGLRLGAPMGGTEANVFRGTWYGSDVAVKLIQGSSYSQAQDLRAALGCQLTHPHIVSTLTVAVSSNAGTARASDSAIDACGPGGESTSSSDTCSVADSAASLMMEGGASPSAAVEAWLVMEMCDKGTLQDALECGWLRTGAPSCNLPGDNISRCTPHLRVVATALEVARAMAYLHERGVVHGDLTASSVLLTSRGRGDTNCRGFVAKVGNFTRALNLHNSRHVVAPLYSRNYAYLAPEVLASGLYSHAADIYSFGVLLWQMQTCKRPWELLSQKQLTECRPPLPLPPGIPADYQALVRSCVAYRPQDRPTFQQLCAVLQDMHQEGEDSLVPAALPNSAYSFIQSL